MNANDIGVIASLLRGLAQRTEVVADEQLQADNAAKLKFTTAQASNIERDNREELDRIAAGLATVLEQVHTIARGWPAGSVPSGRQRGRTARTAPGRPNESARTSGRGRPGVPQPRAKGRGLPRGALRHNALGLDGRGRKDRQKMIVTFKVRFGLLQALTLAGISARAPIEYGLWWYREDVPENGCTAVLWGSWREMTENLKSGALAFLLTRPEEPSRAPGPILYLQQLIREHLAKGHEVLLDLNGHVTRVTELPGVGLTEAPEEPEVSE